MLLQIQLLHRKHSFNILYILLFKCMGIISNTFKLKIYSEVQLLQTSVIVAYA